MAEDDVGNDPLGPDLKGGHRRSSNGGPLVAAAAGGEKLGLGVGGRRGKKEKPPPAPSPLRVPVSRCARSTGKWAVTSARCRFSGGREKPLKIHRGRKYWYIYR